MAVQSLGDESKPMTLKLPLDVDNAITETAKANYETRQAWIRRVIIEALRAQGRLP